MIGAMRGGCQGLCKGIGEGGVRAKVSMVGPRPSSRRRGGSLHNTDAKSPPGLKVLRARCVSTALSSAVSLREWIEVHRPPRLILRSMHKQVLFDKS